MVIEICATLICVSFIALTIFVIATLLVSRKKLKRIEKETNNLSSRGLELIENLNELTEDLKRKSQSLDFLFHFIGSFNRKKSTKPSPGKTKNREQIAEIIDLVSTGLDLFNRVKTDVKKYIKK